MNKEYVDAMEKANEKFEKEMGLPPAKFDEFCSLVVKTQQPYLNFLTMAKNLDKNMGREMFKSSLSALLQLYFDNYDELFSFLTELREHISEIEKDLHETMEVDLNDKADEL